MTPELYDPIYRSFKDYRAESRAVASLLRERVPDAKSILDVACGTGEHALYLQREHGFEVHGIDIEPAFVELARRKLPEARFTVADMADFDLGQRFDAVLCLFSSIGYLTDIHRVRDAFHCFRRHINPRGAAVIEPWFTPDVWNPGRVYVTTARDDRLHVVRMSHSGRRGSVSTLDFHYLIGRPDGVEHRFEHHELGLYTDRQMRDALESAGFEVEHDAEGLTDRGLYLGTPGSE